MRKRVNFLQYLLSALVLAALAGCGATNGSISQGGATKPITAKIVAASVADIAKITYKVTGAKTPTATVVVNKVAGQPISSSSSISVYPADDLVLSVVAVDASGAVVYEGITSEISVDVDASGNTIQKVKGKAAASVNVTMVDPKAKPSEVNCVGCHADTKDTNGENLISNYKQTKHYYNNYSSTWSKNGGKTPGCAGCHGVKHNDVDPGTSGRCLECHDGANNPSTVLMLNANHSTSGYLSADVAGTAKNCNKCHSNHKVKGKMGCIDCHSVQQNANATTGGSLVADNNNGVRAVVGEFSKWSHHVTGANLNNAHCAACHLEGMVSDSGNEVMVDPANHMVDGNVHLRNVDNDEELLWNPAQPNFTTIDNFCLSCHDANGATSPGSVKIQNYINAKGYNAVGKTASATNPFGDTISNQYDKLQRPAVVDAKGQFATTNPSHHAVLGKKYTGRTRVGTYRAVATTFASNSSARMPGVRSTIYDAGKFDSTYQTLSPVPNTTDTSLGDDSVLHCADCHTVGQYSTKAPGYKGRYNKAVIGAHGSNNEYLLRNNIGTDQRHQGAETDGGLSGGSATLGYGTKPYLVCFNCHAFATYGSVGASTSAAGLNHAGEYANSTRCNGPYNTVFGSMTSQARLNFTVGEERLTSVNTIATTAGVRTTSTFGNVFGIQCANCHNSGITAGNIFGGIHGSKDTTYTDGMGNTTKHFRFMPGLANVMFVPGTKGGFTGGSLTPYYSYSSDRNGTYGFQNRSGITFTALPFRAIVPGVSPAASTQLNGVTIPATVLPYLNTLPPKGNGNIITGSYQYISGGVSLDLNWEQKSAQPVAGEFDFQAKAMGCYTLTSATALTTSAAGAANQANGTRSTSAASYNIQAGLPGPNGTTAMFDNWGGCDDHNGAQGAGTAPFRKVLRKTSY